LEFVIDVVGFGESSVDYVHVVPELPRPGVAKLPIASRYSSYGGQVATTMAACAALGLSSGYLGAVGADDIGRRIRDELKRRGVDLSRLVVREAATRYAVILVEQQRGDRLVLSGRDRGLDLPPGEVTSSLVAGARVVHVDATDEAASIEIARRGREAGATVTCDVEAVTGRTPELLSHVTVPILAEAVPQALTGVTGVEPALRALRCRHRGMLCVTLGERGAAALDGEQFVYVPGVQVNAVDTTGAGDVFRAGFIYGVLRAWPIERTLRFANAAAAIGCTRRGAIDSVPALDEVERSL
jgi:sugar/nucleoside kinase (ribokinase family)